jgi:hypothetical protein
MRVHLFGAGDPGVLPRMVFTAKRDIAAGEELTVAYYHEDDLVCVRHAPIVIKLTLVSLFSLLTIKDSSQSGAVADQSIARRLSSCIMCRMYTMY